MSALPAHDMPPLARTGNLPRGKLGVLLLILSEVFFFGTLIAVYVFYIGHHTGGPTPKDVFDAPLSSPTWQPLAVSFNSVFLLVSSLWIVLAHHALCRGATTAFGFWWLATFACGSVFLAGTANEWHGLIMDDGLWMGTNLFGSCYYTLVGFHALHVTAGLTIMVIVFVLTLAGKMHQRHAGKIELLSWYWHFVDAVWIVVFTIVYVIGYWGAA